MHIRTQPYTPVHICTHPPPLIYPSRYTRTYHLAKTKKTVLHKASIGDVQCTQTTVPALIERCCSNKQRGFLGAFVFNLSKVPL